MKIGILTLPQETNYGGILQAFALQYTLRKMGHDAITIDRHNRKEYTSFMRHIGGYSKRLYQHYFLGNKNVTTKWNPFITDDEYKKSSAETQKFIDRNIKLTKHVFSDELAEIDKEYQFDAYVVGSDQVWLDNYCPSSFLDFVHRPNVKKVTYAASCGKKSFFNNPSKVARCRELAKTFSGISVREQQLIAKCKDYLDVEAQWVLDPTLLLESDEYLEAITNNAVGDPIVFSYILDANAEKDAMVDYISKALHFPVVNGNRIEDTRNMCKTFPSVDNWLHNINRARFVITDSFHGTVFSLLFNKDFITIGNEKRGIDRFLSLLKLFKLEERLVINNDESTIKSLLESQIVYSDVNKMIKKLRDQSLQFLIKSLKNE